MLALRLDGMHIITSRRSALLSGAAAAAMPTAGHAKSIGDGCPECVNKELTTSPFIEELLRRTEANKERNEAIVKASTAAKNDFIEEETKMVRYAGVNDAVPVTRMMTKSQIKELEAKGFVVSCPDWGGACEVKAAPPPAPPPPPPPSPPPLIDAEAAPDSATAAAPASRDRCRYSCTT